MKRLSITIVLQIGVLTPLFGQWINCSGTSSSTCTSGNVGIGTTSPAYPLDVNGDARIHGTLFGTSGGTAVDLSAQNLLDDTNSSFETGNGFGPFNGNTVLTRDNTTSAYGNYSLKTVYAAGCGGGWANCTIIGAVVSYQPTNPAKQTVTWTFWAKASESTTSIDVILTGSCGGASKNLGLTANWQKFAISATFTNPVCTGEALYFNQSTSVGHAVTLWLDGIQANWGTFGSNWSPGPVLSETYNLNVPGTGSSYVMGALGIGTQNPCTNGQAPPNCRLSVLGGIQANEVVVNTGWSDYVFEPGYSLSSLRDVEHYVLSNHHLPGIPSASEVAEKGVSLGEMQAKLLAKVEELTLHMIEAEKRADRFEKQYSELKRAVSRQQSTKGRIK